MLTTWGFPGWRDTLQSHVRLYFTVERHQLPTISPSAEQSDEGQIGSLLQTVLYEVDQ